MYLVKFHFVKQVISFLSEVKTELSRVIWPKKNEVIKLTLVVIVISAAVGAYLGILDYLFVRLLEVIVSG